MIRERLRNSFGWTVAFNEGKGISDGANTALKRVESKWFISFEQDLILARDWWNKIPKALENPKVAAASGMRFADKPAGFGGCSSTWQKNTEAKPSLSRGSEAERWLPSPWAKLWTTRSTGLKWLGLWAVSPSLSQVQALTRYWLTWLIRAGIIGMWIIVFSQCISDAV